MFAYRLESAADFAWVVGAVELGIAIEVFEDPIVVMVVLELLDVPAVPPVVPSMGDVFDCAFFASAAKASMVLDWLVAGLRGDSISN